MSTLQHTLQPAFRNRLALAVLLAAAMAAVTATLIISASNTSSGGATAQPSQATLQRQLEAVSGPRYGLKPPVTGSIAPKRVSPQQQLEAVAGPRYHQPGWMLRQR